MQKLLIMLLLSTGIASGQSLANSTIMKTPFVVGYIQFSPTASAPPDMFFRRTGAGTACLGSTSSTCTGMTFTVDNIIVPQLTTVGTLTSTTTTVSGTFKLSAFGNVNTRCLTITSTQTVTPDTYPCESINGITQSTIIAPQIGDVPMAVSTTQWQWQTIAKLASASPTVNHAVCVKATGPPVLYGFCSSVVDATGACTCN